MRGQRGLLDRALINIGRLVSVLEEAPDFTLTVGSVVRDLFPDFVQSRKHRDFHSANGEVLFAQRELLQINNDINLISSINLLVESKQIPLSPGDTPPTLMCVGYFRMGSVTDGVRLR